MATELYDLTVPIYLRGLSNLSKWLEKARTFADEKGIAHEELLNARLIDDMLPLTAQIQRVSDTSKGCLVRVGGVENVPMEDNEASFDELQVRIAKTVEFLKSVPPEAMNGKEGDDVILKLPAGEFPFTGSSFVHAFAIPNFYFHLTTAYAILRSKGVPVGKIDFLGGL